MKKYLLFTGLLAAIAFLPPSSVSATSGFQAGRIIDDSIFTNKSSMSVNDIQNFLNSKVPTCDTNGQQLSEFGGPDLNGDGKVQRWEYGKQYYNQTTFPCLRNYTQDGVSAAQMIYNASQTYAINPQVMIVLLQKEQGLITDTWPLNIQYRSATGYGCPDTAACDSQYYGLKNQLNWAATMFRAIMNDSPTWYTPYETGNNYIQYSPNSSCGGSNVNIINRSTQALYNYTPYQPNSAAIGAPMGATVDCGAYGNLNFYRYFTSWFGATSGPAYAWQELSQKIYTSDEKRTEIDYTNVGSAQYVYIEYTVKNIGSVTWPKGLVLLGRGSDSPFCTREWIACSRATTVNKTNDIKPGETATFGFWMRTPQVAGAYKVYWNLLIENVSWFADIGSHHNIIVKNKPMPNHLGSATPFMKLGDSLYSLDRLNSITLLNTGNLTIYRKGAPVKTVAKGVHELRQQGDGNLVAYSKQGTPIWAVGDGKLRQLYINNDGKLSYKMDINDDGLVIESWNILDGQFDRLHAESLITQDQALVSDNKLYSLILQRDGNLVQYGPKGPMWSTGYNAGSFLVQQGDGKLVLYDYIGRAIWSSQTWLSDGSKSFTVMQGDGNLVTYNNFKPVWDRR